MRSFTTAALALSMIVSSSALIGCDKEMKREETTKTDTNGNTTKEEKVVKQDANGVVTKEEKKTVDNTHNP